MVDITPENFEEQVLQKSHQVPVVVDYWAPWCGPCRVLGPVLEELETEGAGAWVLAKINTEDHPELGSKFEIRGIPAVKAFMDGNVVSEFVGALPKSKVKDWLKNLVPSEADELTSQAMALREQGDHIAAAGKLQEALALEGTHPVALLSLASMMLDNNDKDGARAALKRMSPKLDPMAERAKNALLLKLEVGDTDVAELLKAVEQSPDDLDARWALAHALVAGSQHEEGLEQLLFMVGNDRKYRDDGARKAMLEVFSLVGDRSPLADKWRQKLSMELFK